MRILFLNKIVAMLTLQFKLNQVVADKQGGGPWYEYNWPWLNAIIAEAGELIQHSGFEWWKESKSDQEQLQLEVIDLLHFSLSQRMQRLDKMNDATMTALANQLTDEVMRVSGSEALPDVSGSLKKYLGIVTFKGSVNFGAMLELILSVGMTFDEAYKLFIGKNVLNNFRQANGYKEDSYVKIWGEEEDNVHMMRIVSKLDPNLEDFEEVLTAELEEAYSEVKPTEKAPTPPKKAPAKKAATKSEQSEK